MKEQEEIPLYFRVDGMAEHEANRNVSERDYSDCWEATPFKHAQYILNIAVSGKDVLLTGNLTELNFPENITIQNNSLNFEHIIHYISIFEGLNVGDKESLEKKLMSFGSNYLKHQVDTILNIAELDDSNNLITQIESIIPEWQIEDGVDLKTYLKNLRHSPNTKIYLNFLKNLFKDSDNSVSALILKLDEKIKIALKTNHELLSETETAYSLGKEKNLLGSRVGLGFHPHPAFFHDDWNDIRFQDGHIKAGIAYSNTPEIYGGADQDAPAMISLYRKGWDIMIHSVKEAEAKKISNNKKKSLIAEGWIVKSENDYSITMEKDNQEDIVIKMTDSIAKIPIYVPPNMANIYLFKVPGLTPKMEEELGGNLARYYPNVKDFSDNRDITVIVVTNKSRINPTKFSQTCDSEFGEGRWLLLTNEGDAKLSVLKPKPNADTLDRPRYYGPNPKNTRRPNIPLPATFYKAFS